MRSLLTVLLALILTGCGRPPELPEAARVEVDDEIVPKEESEKDLSAPKQTFAIDHDSEFNFTGYYVAGSQTGGFLMFDGTWTMQGVDIETGQLEIIFFPDSIYSSDDRLTRNLIGENFFDAMNYPEGTFTSVRIEREEKLYRITGDLTLREMTQRLSFPAEIAMDEDTLTLSASFQVDRNWWELGRTGFGDYAMRDRVDVAITLSAQKE